MSKLASGLAVEPQNGARPPLRAGAGTDRGGAESPMPIAPGEPWKKERAERLPGEVAQELGNALGGRGRHDLDAMDRRAKRQAGREARSEARRIGSKLEGGYGRRIRDGSQLLGTDDQPPKRFGRKDPRIELENSGDLRRLVRRYAASRPLPGRGVASAGIFRTGWDEPTRALSDEGRGLLEEYLRRHTLAHATTIGLTARAAGELAYGLKKTQASAILRELEQEGGPAGWIRRRAAILLAEGRLPRGRDMKPDCHATAFWKAVLGPDGSRALDRWVYNNGYRTTMDAYAYRKATEGLDWHVREPLDYFVQSGHIQEMFP